MKQEKIYTDIGERYSSSYDKYVYYLIGINVACLGFIFQNQNIEDFKFVWSNPCLILSILLFTISIFSGLINRRKDIDCLWLQKEVILSENKINDLVDKINKYCNTDTENYNDLEIIHKEISKLKDWRITIMDDEEIAKSTKIGIFLNIQYWSLIGGVIIYIIHIFVKAN